MLIFTSISVLCGCDISSSKTPTRAITYSSSLIPLEASLLKQWGRTCGLCHINGEGGAPRVGVLDDWQSRRLQGPAVLLEHTIEGFNKMPPLGYCMSCSRDDFKNLIAFMSRVSR